MGNKDTKFDYVGLWISHNDIGHFGIMMSEQESGDGLEGICLDRMGSATIKRVFITPSAVGFIKRYDGRHNVMEISDNKVWVPSPGPIFYDGYMKEEFKAPPNTKLRDIPSYVGIYETVLHNGRFIMQSAIDLKPELNEELMSYVEKFRIPDRLSI